MMAKENKVEAALTVQGLPTHDGELFSWAGNAGFAEESDLGPVPFARVAKGEPAFMVKSRTGRTMVFSFADTVFDSRGPNREVHGHVFRSGAYEITLFND